MPNITLPDGFTVAELTNVVDLMPIQYGDVTNSGLFVFKGMNVNVAAIARNSHSLCLVPTAEWCGPAKAKNARARRDLVFIDVPHTPITDLVHPCDVMGRKLFDMNTDEGLMDMAGVVTERMADMRSKLEITKEYRYVRALFGEVLDSNGDILHDLYADFGYTRDVVTFEFSDPNFDVQIACMDLRRRVRKAYKGLFSGIEARVDAEFFDKLISHPKVRDSYKRCCDTNALTTGDVGTLVGGFPFGQIMWKENIAEACAVADDGSTSTVQFMASPINPADDEPYGTVGVGTVYPVGTTNNYELLAAPPTMNDLVNKKAESEYYASLEPRCHNEGFDLKMQMNTCPIVKQPNALITVVAA
jgi:Phage major capsid protein E